MLLGETRIIPGGKPIDVFCSNPELLKLRQNPSTLASRLGGCFFRTSNLSLGKDCVTGDQAYAGPRIIGAVVVVDFTRSAMCCLCWYGSDPQQPYHRTSKAQCVRHPSMFAQVRSGRQLVSSAGSVWPRLARSSLPTPPPRPKGDPGISGFNGSRFGGGSTLAGGEKDGDERMTARRARTPAEKGPVSGQSAFVGV